MERFIFTLLIASVVGAESRAADPVVQNRKLSAWIADIVDSPVPDRVEKAMAVLAANAEKLLPDPVVPDRVAECSGKSLRG